MHDPHSLLAEAVLGRDAEEFFQSDIGKYVLGCCEQEEQEALELLSTTWSWRRRRIQELQNKVWRARSVRLWLADLVTAGRTAEAVLEAEHE